MLGFNAIRTCQTPFTFPKQMAAVDPVKEGTKEDITAGLVESIAQRVSVMAK